MTVKVFDCEKRSIYVAGHRGRLGRAVVRLLTKKGANVECVPRANLDLGDPAATLNWLGKVIPDAIICCAGRAGGISAHITSPADMCRENIAIALSVISAAHLIGVDRLVYVGSSAVYPTDAPQPYCESTILDGPPDLTHRGYASAMRTVISLCECYSEQFGRTYITALPTNLYDPLAETLGDTNVIPMMIEKFRKARQEKLPRVPIWGTGSPKREFLHVDDAASAIVRLLEYGNGNMTVNVSSGNEVTISELASLIAERYGFCGEIYFDNTKPDGVARRSLDCSQIKSLGWRPTRTLRDGIEEYFEQLRK